MSSYFSMPSFARAKQNQEKLEKSNPQKPVLNEEDEKFLDEQIKAGKLPAEAKDAPPTKITEGGEEKEASKEEAEQAGTSADQAIVPEQKPSTEESSQESKADDKPEEKPAETADDPPEQAPEDSAPAAKAKPKPKKNKSFELPSQEEAEAATRSFKVGEDKSDASQGQQGDKRTWASYLPTMRTGAKKDESAGDKAADKTAESTEKGDADAKDGEKAEPGQQRTWAEYASNAYSALPSIPIPASLKSKDGKPEPVYKEDGTIDEEKTKEKQEREVSVLLDNVNMSSINNRVFALSGETQKIYERFTQVLKDTMNGGPTAYEDMEKLMRDAGPQLEKQFQSMPPFVQTLVKSLPAKLGTTLGPELLAAASEKPGADMNARMAAASKQSSSGGEPSLQTKSTSTETTEDGKKKRKIPGLKGLVSQQGAVASILRSVVNFITTRFPFLASATNVVMSLSVFILMFVFWYCHKRGKETRLAREGESAQSGDGVEEDEDGNIEVDVTDEEAEEEEGEDEKADAEAGAAGVDEASEKQKEDVLNQPEPTDVPLPDKEKGEKGAELEATKSVGV